GIEDGDRGRGVTGRIDDDGERSLSASLLDPVDQLALMVGLTELDLELVTGCGLAAELFNVLQLRAAIFVRLAGAEQIEVGAVENVDGFRPGGGTRKQRRSFGL